MKLKRLSALITVFLLCSAVVAQDYFIRVTYNTNLRASSSLESDIVETAPKGATLHVIGEFNRWLKINTSGNEVWMAGWVSYTPVEDSGQTASQTMSEVDNCCFVDRQCNTDQQWTDGYWAFQNGQCAAPAESQTELSAQPASNAPGQIDNCCFASWHCSTDQQWTNGYWAAQNNQCDRSQVSTSAADSCCDLGWNCTLAEDWIFGKWVLADTGQCGSPLYVTVDRLIIQGSETFIGQVRAALDLLRTRAPEWYEYVMVGLDKIREAPDVMGDGTHGTSFSITTSSAAFGRLFVASSIVHDACHGHQNLTNSTLSSGVERELECTIIQLEASRVFAPHLITWLEELIDNIHDPAYQWWLPRGN